MPLRGSSTRRPGPTPHLDDDRDALYHILTELALEIARAAMNRMEAPLNPVPPEVAELLASTSSSGEEVAWQKFVQRYSRLILVTVKALSWDHDEAMDHYVFVLEGLRGDDYRRLRRYASDNRGQFSAWLVVVTRRLCLDYRRQRYGRIPPAHQSGQPSRQRAVERRRLIDLVTEELDITKTADPSGANPEVEVRQAELQAALQAAVRCLPPKDRLLLRLRFDDGRTAREIADAMGFPSVFHVYRRLKKVLATLGKLLRERGVSDALP